MTRVVLTAGFDRSPHVIALATLLQRDGIIVAGILVTRAATLGRLRALIRERGLRFALAGIRRFLGRVSSENVSPLRDFLKENGITDRSLQQWCKRQDIPRRVVASLNDERALAFLRAAQATGVLYGGGGILKSAFIEAASGRILNAHHGPLPEIRGMNACEWSLLLGAPPSVTVHFIDTGIDTGSVVERVPISVGVSTIGLLRERCAVAGIEGLRRNVPALHAALPAVDPDRKAHKQVYTLATALREILESRLEAGKYDSRGLRI